MDCAKAAELFNSYIDNTLTAATRRELEAHLLSCPDCAAELEALQGLSKSLRSLPQPELPAGFAQALHEALAAEPAPPRPALWQRGWAKGVAAAACLLLIIGAVAIGGNALSNNRYNTSSLMFGGSAASTPAAEAPMAVPAPAAMNEGAIMMDDSYVQDFIMPEEEEMELRFTQEAPATEPGMGADGMDTGGETTKTAGNTEKQMERKIIKDARLSLRVADFEQAYQSLSLLAEHYGGYVVSSVAYGYDGEHMQRGYITLRVDADRLDEALTEIDTMGKVENKSTNTQDITMAYYDIAGRLDQYKLQEQRLLDIMKKAETVEDLISLESELTRVRAELESLTGQLRYYDQMTTLSSINVDLYQPDDYTQTVKLSGWEAFEQDIREGFIGGINGLIRFFSSLAVGFVRLLPSLLLLAVLALIVILFVRKRRK